MTTAFFKIETKNIAKLEKQLMTFKKKAVPFATRQTLSDAVVQGRNIAQKEVSNNFILRNTWTRNSIRFDKGNTRRELNIDKQYAKLGSLQEYMRKQEIGGTNRPDKGRSKPIPTATASNEGDNAHPPKKLPTRTNRRKNVRLMQKNKTGRNKRQENIIAVNTALETKQKFIYMDTVRSKGIFRITGRRGNPRIKMIWNLSRKTTPVRKKPWLAPTTKIVRSKIPSIYEQNLIRQLKRHGLFNT